MKKVNFVAALIAVAMTMAIVSCGSNGTSTPVGVAGDSVVSPGVQDTLVADTLIVSPDTIK